jgi:hypothetical protein
MCRSRTVDNEARASLRRFVALRLDFGLLRFGILICSAGVDAGQISEVIQEAPGRGARVGLVGVRDGLVDHSGERDISCGHATIVRRVVPSRRVSGLERSSEQRIGTRTIRPATDGVDTRRHDQ